MPSSKGKFGASRLTKRSSDANGLPSGNVDLLEISTLRLCGGGCGDV